MTDPVKRFTANAQGRDFVVGDIHGCFSRLQTALDAIGFNPEQDRLFAAGDLVDRGPESEKAIDWLAKPWFHAVRGNHDDYVCRYDTCDTGNWFESGGVWFAALPSDQQAEHAVMFRELPIAIEVETADGGRFGIVHAGCPLPSWPQLLQELEAPESPKRGKQLRNACMWSRVRIEHEDKSKIAGVDYVVVGHQPLQGKPRVLGNTLYIDTMGWRNGLFTFLNMTERVIEQA